MKLPDDPKERNQYIILGVIVLAAVGYVLVQFVIKPGIAKRKLRAATIIELQDKIENAERTTGRIRADRDNALSMAKKVLEIADQYVLTPTLGGNFLLGAQDIIEKNARDAGVTLDAIRQSGEAKMPKSANRKQPNAFGSYTVTIQFSGSLNALAKFLQEVEDSNPYISVTSLTINPQANDPENHAFSLQVSWPIWERDNVRKDLLKQVES